MVYKPRTKERTLNALKFGHWTWNKTVIVADNYFVIGNNTKKKRFWLKIRNVDTSDSGIYSFVVNGTVVSQWQLLVNTIPTSELYLGKKKVKKKLFGSLLK